MARWPTKRKLPSETLDALRPRGNGGYADLLLSYAEFGLVGMSGFAEALGYQPEDEKPGPRLREEFAATEISQLPLTHQTAPVFTDPQAAELPFWQPYRYTRLEQPENPLSEPQPDPQKPWRGLPAQAPAMKDLAPWRDIASRIRKAFATPLATSAPDLDAIVRHLARGRLLDRLPRQRRRRWGERVQIIVDFSTRLTPFFQDQQRAADRLSRLFPRHAIEYASFATGDEEPCIVSCRHPPQRYRVPASGTLVIVLGDLGCLDTMPEEAARPWADLGRRLLRAGCRPVALNPCPSPRWLTDLLRGWTMVPWGPGSAAAAHTQEQREARATRLLRLAALAIRIEPGLLRDLRLLLGAAADAGTESDVWQRVEMIGRHPVAGRLDPVAAKRLRQEGAEKESLDLRVQAAIAVWRWRGGEMARGVGFESVWFEEFDSFGPELRQHLPTEIADGAAEAAYRNWRTYLDTLDQYALGRAWIREVFARAPEDFLVEGGLATQAIKQTLFLKAHEGSSLPPALPDGFIPGLGRPRKPERLLDVRLVGKSITATNTAMTRAPGSLLALLRAGEDELVVGHFDPFWATGKAPPWADDWGTDEYGPWVTFSVAAEDGSRVIQRMRWCPPGRFLMGSPDTEAGRFDAEGPVHEVQIAEGFWMFTTVCTEELWMAVMNRPTGSGRTGRFPATEVSWQDAQDFIEILNARLPGLALGLPSEAIWEYACRAGTTTPYNFGETIDKTKVNFDGRGPVPAGSLPPNRWGFHEMHGNFYEWCADHWHASYVGAPADGSAWIDHDKAAARRVLRGGSWFSAARRVRSASRDHAGPGHRIYIGFRCARVQVASGAEQVAAPADPARRPGAERGRPQGPTGAAALLRVGAAVPCPAPRGGAFLIRSDWEELRFRRFDRPAWASAVGRDKYGLFCTFAVPGTEIIQRMRWIPPGRFRMGSPDDEPDRFADEGPVHEVTLAEGFWLFDTPCTQALWQAVMDRNPSRFESPTRPVEQVSYDDAQSFLTKLNALLPGLSLALPSEAQWEYACRAGTETATYAGKMDILGEHNAPVLDGIAWYGGNSGVDYDLPDGADSSNWPEKAYAHARAGTRPVAGKAANGFGLYDMLGNVMEWCADHWHNSYEGAPVDGSPWIDPDKAAANRVLRGGSWGNAARNVRSACRDASGPAYRYARIGFRCARVQGYSEATAAAEGREEQAPGAERGAATTSPQRARGADSAKRTKRRK